MSKPIAVQGSMHTCPMCSGSTPHVGGIITGACATGVTIDGVPIALQGDKCNCVGAVDTIVQGSAGVFVNGAAVATIGSMSAHGGQVTTGIEGVTISANTPNDTVTLPASKIPVPPENTLSKLLTALSGNSNQEAKEKQALLQQEDTGEPRVYNLQWRKDQVITRETMQIRQITLTADVMNIPDGETTKITIVIPETIDSSKETIELSGTITDKKVTIIWEIEDLEDTHNT